MDEESEHLKEYFVVTKPWSGSVYRNVFKASSPKDAALAIAAQLDTFKSIEVLSNDNRELLATFEESDFHIHTKNPESEERGTSDRNWSGNRFVNWFLVVSCILAVVYVIIGALKPKTGEITYAEWYEVIENGQLRYVFRESGHSQQDETARHLSTESQKLIEEHMPGIEGTKWGYGAIYRKGTSGSGWMVFPTKQDAINFLLQNGVERDNIWEN